MLFLCRLDARLCMYVIGGCVCVDVLVQRILGLVPEGDVLRCERAPYECMTFRLLSVVSKWKRSISIMRFFGCGCVM